MIGETKAFDDSDTGLSETRHIAGARESVARSLSGEFTAPVGIFDPRGRRWRRLVGATGSQFPVISDPLVRRGLASDLAIGQVALWRSPENRDHVWLMIPLPSAGGTAEVAIVGFRSASSSARSTPAWDEDTKDYAVDQIDWGPACPDAALRAWGQQAADRLRNQRPSRKDPLRPPHQARARTGAS